MYLMSVYLMSVYHCWSWSGVEEGEGWECEVRRRRWYNNKNSILRIWRKIYKNVKVRNIYWKKIVKNLRGRRGISCQDAPFSTYFQRILTHFQRIFWQFCVQNFDVHRILTHFLTILAISNAFLRIFCQFCIQNFDFQCIFYTFSNIFVDFQCIFTYFLSI